jgi:hypothetical protein
MEGFSGSSVILFKSLSSDAVLEDITRLKLCANLGVSPRQPMALLVAGMKRQARPQATNELVENPDPLEMRYSASKFPIVILDSYSFLVYYHVYDEEGEVISKAAFDENDTFLGRIDTLSIAPPYTVAFLKARIMKVEGIIDRAIQLFEDTNGEVRMNDADRAPFYAETFPGCIEDYPLAVVYSSKNAEFDVNHDKGDSSKIQFQ